MKFIRQYDEGWIDDFNDIARFLGTYLPDEMLIHHVGSTSIPSMPSKDIIDIDIECPNGSINRVIAVLTQAGYEHEGDLGIPTREAFSPRDDSNVFRLRPHHLYACESDSPELRRHLVFRDYLIAHPERASWLADEKRRADELAVSRDAYIEGTAPASGEG